MKYKFLFLTLIPFILLSNTSYATCTGNTQTEIIQCLNSQFDSLTLNIQNLNDNLHSLQAQSETNDKSISTISQSLQTQMQLETQDLNQLGADLINQIYITDKSTSQYSDDKVLKAILPGTVIAFAGDTIPNGWLLCNGKPLSKATYPQLAQVLGDKYGPNSDGNFYPPDYQGVFLRGTSGTSGRDPDAESRTALNGGTAKGNMVGSYQDDMFKSHNHGYNPNILVDGGGDFVTGGSTYNSNHPNNRSTDYSGGNETRPKNVSVYYIIKM